MGIKTVETFFAPAERDDGPELNWKIELVSKNPVIDGLMTTVSGIFAVLNERRQVLAVNKAFLDYLGIADAMDLLGMRPGEVLHCVHANEMPGGCGTGRLCASCGAAIALVSSLGQNNPVERMCSIAVTRNGREADMFLSVRSCPVNFNGSRLLLLYIQDISRQQQLASLERAFFHDINNILMGIIGASTLLAISKEENVLIMAKSVHQQTLRLAQEIRFQQYMTRADLDGFHAVNSDVSLTQIFDEVRQIFSEHPAARGKCLNIAGPFHELEFKTDICLLTRILCNMVINALEATEMGEDIRVCDSLSDGNVGFHVWNRQAIPGEIAGRIFQRNFSTKQEIGRGLGTYSMKLLGEEFLGGKVSFITSEKEGTTFSLFLPLGQTSIK